MSRRLERAFDHVLIVMFENQYRSYVLENRYMKWLAGRGIDMANYFGVMHPSQTNYIASIAGELCNVTSDDLPAGWPLPQRTIVDLIEEAPGGVRWKAYMESYIPQNAPWTPTFTPQDEFPYLIKHNPFSSFERIVRSRERWQRVVGESRFWIDLLNDDLPEFAWFTPNMWNDGHYLDGTQTDPDPRAPVLVDQLAEWLEGFFGALRFPGPDSHLPPRTLVVVTFDEADFEAAFTRGQASTYDGPNQVYTVLLGDGIEPGVEEEGYNHYSLLRTIEQNFGLGSLGKNDAGANWFQFLWRRRFRWRDGGETPIAAAGPVALAGFERALWAVYAGADGRLVSRTLDGDRWSDERPVGQQAAGPLALADAGDRLLLAYRAADGTVESIAYTPGGGWSSQPEMAVSEPVAELALTAYRGGGEESGDAGAGVMLACRTEAGDLVSRTWAGGAWQGDPAPVGHSSDGALTLAALGASLYLIAKVPGHDLLQAISYNTADFNVVEVPTNPYGGAQDDTTRDAWSPSAFPVEHFSTARDPITPGEEEPAAEAYPARGPLAAAVLDGVLHLAWTAVDGSGLRTATLSVAGLMTPADPVSYDAGREADSSNGFGTLAEAGWSRETALAGLRLRTGGALAMARDGTRLVLLHQPEDGGPLRLAVGRFEREG